MKRRPILMAMLVVVSAAACRYEPAHETPRRDSQSIVSVLSSFVDRDPNDYVTIYTLARFAERSGNTREVVHWLRRLEATSWDRVIDEGDFPSSSSDPRFRSVRDRLDARALVVLGAEHAFEIDQLDLLPEGMAYDPTSDRFLVSSGRQRKVVSVGRDGRSIDLVAPAQDGLLATLGMKVDDRRRELWVASAAAPFMIDAREEDAGKSALYSFDADSGATKGRWDVAWSPSLLNDLVVAPDGSVFATESMTGAILRRIRGATTLDVYLPQETFFSPNGIAISEDGASLYVAHYHGISRVDVRSREIVPLTSDDPTLRLGGIDGLYWHDERLVGIQNLVGKGRIWSIGLDGDDITSAEILESGNPSFRNPTTGAIAGRGFFFLENPKLQEWRGQEVSAAPAGERLRVRWLPLGHEPGMRRLTRGPDRDQYPAWSPSGAFMAFERASSSSTDESSLMRLDIAESSVSPIGAGAQPTFDRQGRLLFVSEGNGGRDVYVRDLQTGESGAIATTIADEQHPDVSVSGVVAASAPVDGVLQVLVLDTDGQLRQVTNGSQQSLWPRWAPDGDSLLYFSRRDGNDELYIQSVDSSSPATRVTNREGHDFCPAWSPDGSRIAVAVSSESRGRRIDVINLEGNVLCTFAGGFERVSYPAWSPDGASIAFSARENGDWDLWEYRLPGQCGNPSQPAH